MNIKCNMCEKCVTCQDCYTNQQSNVEEFDISKDPKIIPVNNATIFVTTKCNLRCKYCYLWHYGENKQLSGENAGRYQMDMTEETMKATIDFLFANTKQNYINIWFFGGEPFLNKEVIRFAVDYSQKLCKLTGKKVSYGATSNLTLIDDEWNKFLKQWNFGILASLDGCKEIHDRNRIYMNGKGSWNKAIEGLNKICEWKPREQITIRWTVIPQDIDSLPENLRYWINMGHTNVAIEWVFEEDWTLYLDKYRNALEKCNNIILEYAIKGKKSTVKHLTDGLKTIFQQNRHSGLRCGTANGHFGVNPKGEIFTCQRFIINFEEEFKIGNVWDGYNLEKCYAINESYWNHEKNCINIVNHQFPEKCNDCWLNVACTGSCLASNFDLYGNITQNPDWVCEMEKIKVEEALHFLLRYRYIFGLDGEEWIRKISNATRAVKTNALEQLKKDVK